MEEPVEKQDAFGVQRGQLAWPVVIGPDCFGSEILFRGRGSHLI
jgi:hypothetical protein